MDPQNVEEKKLWTNKIPRKKIFDSRNIQEKNFGPTKYPRNTPCVPLNLTHSSVSKYFTSLFLICWILWLCFDYKTLSNVLSPEIFCFQNLLVYLPHLVISHEMLICWYLTRDSHNLLSPIRVLLSIRLAQVPKDILKVEENGMLYVAGIMTIIIQIIVCVCFFYKYIYFLVTIPCDKKIVMLESLSITFHQYYQILPDLRWTSL